MPERDQAEAPIGNYANYLNVGCNAFEFVLDFGQFYPEEGHAGACVRIVTSPVYCKRFLRTLEQALREYEAEYGAVPEQ